MIISKLIGLALVVGACVAASSEDDTWDLAVAMNNQIELLKSNGSLWKKPIKKFHLLKALTFNYKDQIFIVSDMNSQNDTIYTITADHDEKTNVLSVVEDLPDDVQGLAIDPINDTLYWTDSIRKSLYNIPLNSKESHNLLQRRNLLFRFHEEQPRGITIDICKRNIYWTNSNFLNSTIERAALDGTDRKVLVDSDLFMPSGITIDQLDQRLYWADMSQGIYFRIESVNLDGSDRRILYNGTSQKPFGLAVDKDYVYWTDINTKALWKKNKFNAKEPKLIRRFSGEPMGLVARNLGFPSEPNCAKLQTMIEEYKNKERGQKENGPVADESRKEHQGNDCPKCICDKGPEKDDSSCDTNKCFNYCLNEGICHISNEGMAECKCKNEFKGQRCEMSVCHEDFCLNGGVCQVEFSTSGVKAKCLCAEGYQGPRCESKNLPYLDICKKICHNITDEVVMDRKGNFICNCFDGSYASINTEQENITTVLKHPLFIGLMATLLVFGAIIVVQSVTIYKRKHKRPRVKKRIVVNKNITPLTDRPQSTIEQCEITIEDCCNMNVCETPCFEPPNLRNFQSRKDDKKALLAHIESNEDYQKHHQHTY